MLGTAKSPQLGSCENVTVTTADGRVFDLGNPASVFFPLRTLIYRLKRKIHG